MTTVRLLNPVEHEGKIHRDIVISRPGPIRFARYWRGRDKKLPLPLKMSLPSDVVDHLHPVDHRHVIAEMARLTAPYVWTVAIWNLCFSKKDVQS